MKVCAIIVARNGSSRIPKKSLIKLSKKPMIWHMIRITKELKNIDAISLATSNLKIDDSISKIAKDEKINLYRGHSEFVLDRIYFAAKKIKADVIVYIGGDCPLLDPNVLNNALLFFLKNKIDYLNN